MPSVLHSFKPAGLPPIPEHYQDVDTVMLALPSKTVKFCDHAGLSPIRMHATYESDDRE